MKLIGVLGGTFDPIHTGHLRLAIESLEQLNLDQVRLIPVGTPNHRAMPTAQTPARLSMLHQAVQQLGEDSTLIVDERELSRQGVSYMVDTLASLKNDFPGDTLCLILGFDAFAKLSSWHRWQTLFDFCHIVIAGRPGETGATPQHTEIQDIDLRNYVADKVLQSPKQLLDASHGKILFMEIPLLEISSTEIRTKRQQGLDISHLVPPVVQTIIENENLYRAPK